MSVATFIPEIWSARLLTTLAKNHVFGSVANRDYEGLIKNQGDTVNINMLTDPTVDDYVSNTTVISPDELTTADQALLIDQAKYFAFYVDDVDARQAAGDMLNVAAERAAYKLRDVADRFLAQKIAEDAGSLVGGQALSNADEVWAELLGLKVKLDEADVPSEGRWAVVTPAIHALLMNSPKFLDASASGSTEPLLNGRVGRAAGFDIRVSNNHGIVEGATPSVTPRISAGHPMGLTFAEQIVKVEAYRPESSFSDAVKGLHVYGAKVVRPEALAVVQTESA